MEMRKIRMHGTTRTIALPLSYLRDLGIQDHEYVAVTLEDNYIAISKPGAQINNPFGAYTPSWKKKAGEQGSNGAGEQKSTPAHQLTSSPAQDKGGHKR